MRTSAWTVKGKATKAAALVGAVGTCLAFGAVAAPAASADSISPAYLISHKLDTSILADCTKPVFKSEGVVAFSTPDVYTSKVVGTNGAGDVEEIDVEEYGFSSAYRDLVCTGESSYYINEYGDHMVERLTVQFWWCNGGCAPMYVDYRPWVSATW